MRFVVILTNKPDTDELRTRHEADHLAYLHRNGGNVLLHGPMRESAGSAPFGGLWVIEAADKAEAEAIINDDPFFKAGLRGKIELYHWGAKGQIGPAA